MSRVLVLGGSGWVGRHVVGRLRELGEDVRATCHTREVTPYVVDLAAPESLGALFARLDAEGWTPDHVVHAAGVRAAGRIEDLTPDVLDHSVRVHAGALLGVCRELARRGTGDGSGQRPIRNIVAFGALDRAQSFPLAAHFAAAQGGLAAAAMALGHELGPRGFRVNVVALGVLDGGAADAVPRAQIEAYTRFSALRRVGTAAEAAATAAWLVRENTALNGKVLPANGGL